MVEYSIDDIEILEKDTTDDPKSFTPKFEVPGEIYGQDYAKRLRHTFPSTEKWKEETELDGETVVRWKKKLFERYLDI